MILGIDATNISSGGGATHLKEVMNYIDSGFSKFDGYVIISNKVVLDSILNSSLISKVWLPIFEKNFVWRFIWQILFSATFFKKRGCDLLFVPGGSYLGFFKPFVTMSRNMLPFEKSEMLRFGFSFMTAKLVLLRLTQQATFARANGIIFLTKYAKNKIQEVTKRKYVNSKIINHGVDVSFSNRSDIRKKSFGANGIKILYASPLSPYKHQINVIEAVRRIRERGVPITLDLVGPDVFGGESVKDIIFKYDPQNNYLRYFGSVPHSDMAKICKNADIGIFASTCENLPNTLLEYMASGLAIASSNFGPMPEVLQDGGVYFNPLCINEIAGAIDVYINFPEQMEEKSLRGFNLSKKYSWKLCAKKTFDYLHAIVSDLKGL